MLEKDKQTNNGPEKNPQFTVISCPPEKNPIYIKLGLIAGNESKIDSYSNQYTATSRLDAARFIQQKSYWLTSSVNNVPKRKKIIVNLIQIFSTSTHYNKPQRRLLNFLISQGFEVFAYTYQKKLKQFIKLSQVNEINLLPTHKLQNELLSQDININEYLILDQQKVHFLLAEFSKIGLLVVADKNFVVVDNKNKESILPIGLMDKISFDSKLDDEKHLSNGLLTLMTDAQYKKISFSCESSLINYYFEWDNRFTLQQQKSLVEELNKSNFNYILDPIYCVQLRVLDIESFNVNSSTSIDLHHFKYLKSLKLNGFIKITNYENLINLDELILNKTQEQVDISKFTAITKLTIKNLDMNNIKGIEHCINLKELSVIGVKNFDTGCFVHLKKLVKFEGGIAPAATSMLEELCIRGDEKQNLSAIIEVLHLSHYPNLKKLTLSDCVVRNITPGDTCPLLEELIIRNAIFANEINLTRVFGVKDFNSLQRLEISNQARDMGKIIDLTTFKSLKSLKIDDECIMVLFREQNQLNYFEWKSSKITGKELNFSTLNNLKVLKLENIKVCGIKGLSDKKSLTYVSMKECNQLYLNDFKTEVAHVPFVLIQQSASNNISMKSEIINNIIEDKNLIETKNLSEKYNHSFDGSMSRPLPTIKCLDFNTSVNDLSIILSAEHDLPMDSRSNVLPTKTVLDDATYTDPNTKVEMCKIFVSADSKIADPAVNLYRMNILDKLNEDDDKMEFGTHAHIYEEYILPPLSNDIRNVYHAAYPGPFRAGYEYILPGLSGSDVLLAITSSDALTIGYSKETGQYKVAVNKAVPRIIYSLRTSIDYFNHYRPFDDKDEKVQSKLVKTKNTLSKELRFSIDTLLAMTPEVNDAPEFTVFKQQIRLATSLDKKKDALLNYCKTFPLKNQPLTIKHPHPIGRFLTMLREGKGACRHASNIFFIMSQYFGFEARLVDNINCHQYIEVLEKTEQGEIWKGYDLGGAQTQVISVNNPFLSDLKTQDFKSLFDSKLSSDVKSTTVESKEALIASPKSDAPFVNDFLIDQSWLLKCKTTDELIEGLFVLSKSPLIRTESTKEAWEWHKLIAKKMHNERECIYIDSAEELRGLLQLTKVTNNSFSTVDGPLKKLITHNGKGIIIVNWTNFTANERAIFKCMIDDPYPTLSNLQLSNNIKVIGLLSKDIIANDVFMSRCHELELPAHLSLNPNASQPTNALILTNDSKANRRSEEINLYGDRDWQELLIGKVSINDDVLAFKEGPLLHAMRNGYSITIKNPPLANNSYDLFWHKFIIEGSVIANGEVIKPKQGFNITIAPNVLSYRSSKKMVMDYKLRQTKGKLFHVSSSEVNNLYNLQHVTDDEKIKSCLPGFLAEYKEGDQIVLTTELTQQQWQRIYDYIDSMQTLNLNMPTIHFYQRQVECKPAINSLATVVSDCKRTLGSVCVQTNDPFFIVDEFRKSLLKDNIFYVESNNLWATQFENISLYTQNGKIRAKRHVKSLWDKLKKGETVVLCGELSSHDYDSIKTLFENPPYLYINGVRESDIKGKLICVSKNQPVYIPAQTFKVSVNEKDWEERLKQDHKQIDNKILDNVKIFLKHFKIFKPDRPGYPSIDKMTYGKFNALYTYASLKSLHENPIKPIFQYYFKKESAEYIYFNVLGKYLFSNTDEAHFRVGKYIKLQEKLSNISSASIDDANNLLWSVANCFSGKSLRTMFSDLPSMIINTQTSPMLPAEAVEILFSTIHQMGLVTTEDGFIKDQKVPFDFKQQGNKRFDKQQSLLKSALYDPQKPIIFCLGESGTGKTFSVKSLIKNNLYVGENTIQDWLDAKASSKDPVVLLLDEANLYDVKKWEFLQGLAQSPPTITFNNKKYNLSPQHKVVVTGNPIHYPGRKWHKVFWDLAHVIWFAPFQPHFIQEKVSEALGAKDIKDIASVSKAINVAYTFLCSKPGNEVTLRDIDNICMRYLNTKRNICDVIYQELIGNILNETTKEEFKSFLIKNYGPLQQSAPTILPKDIVISPDFYEAWSMMLDDLALRKKRVEEKTNINHGKLGLILEGPSGVGKSLMLTKLLELEGFTLDAKDTQKCYYQITAGNDNVKELLLKAFHEGSVVILDELNLEPELEILLNDLLSGVDDQNKTAAKPGFMMLSTQNPANYDGCSRSSLALINRSHKICVDEMTDAGITHLAREMKHINPTGLTQSYNVAKAQHSNINARTLFHVLNKNVKPENNDDFKQNVQKNHKN